MNGSAAEDVTGSLLAGLLSPCPRCGLSIDGHAYHLIAGTVLEPQRAGGLDALLAAVRNHDWKALRAFQNWEGAQNNAEVYAVRCSNASINVNVIFAPFALEDPYLLLHHQAVEPATKFLSLIDDNNWRVISFKENS